jgi:dCMP deaminase
MAQTGDLFMVGDPEAIAKLEASRTRWHLRFMAVAKLVAIWSKDPSTKVGACIVDSGLRTIVATGYNGVPRYMPDDNLADRPSKYSRTIHAEMNAILAAPRLHDTEHALYATFPICDRCAVHAIQAGITHIVCGPFPFDHNTECGITDAMAKWIDANELAQDYCRAAGVTYTTLHDTKG